LPDASHSGEAPVPVPGIVRLVYELVFFCFSVWALFDVRLRTLGIIFSAIVIIHYIVSYERIAWLLRQF